MGRVVGSQRQDLCDYQCNGSFEAAKKLKQPPQKIAEQVIARLGENPMIGQMSIAGNGFINLSLRDDFLAREVEALLPLEALRLSEAARTIVIDYGGPNVAKPLHVGHLRSAIIGESLKRLARRLGHRVVGDIHLGDWGLQMGMVILGLLERFPALAPLENGEIPADLNAFDLSLDDLNQIYPDISGRCKADEALMKRAQQITSDLQAGHAGYRALWERTLTLSIASLKQDYERLDITFDLWLGESSVQDRICGLIERLRKQGHAVESEGAWVIEVKEPGDTADIPPLIVKSSTASALYGTTDLATIEARMEAYHPDEILYVVDNRQALHFKQVFRAARKTGIVLEPTVLEHLGFGTMNGKDGKPFKTREGGTMRLSDLIGLVVDKAKERIVSQTEMETGDLERTALSIGIASLKFGDLINQPGKSYVFDLDKFCSFEGKTGAYVLYGNTRAKSILRKAGERGFAPHGPVLPATDRVERALHLALLTFPERIVAAYAFRQPNFMADYLHQLSTQFNQFYYEHHILTEPDEPRRSSWLRLCTITSRILEAGLNLLGIDSVDRM